MIVYYIYVKSMYVLCMYVCMYTCLLLLELRFCASGRRASAAPSSKLPEKLYMYVHMYVCTVCMYAYCTENKTTDIVALICYVHEYIHIYIHTYIPGHKGRIAL